jgi:hypothetical protein
MYNSMKFFLSHTFSNISQSMLGAISVAAYHRYTHNKITKLNNEKNDMKYKYEWFLLEEKYKREIENLKKENASLKQSANNKWF